jgi:hypothetical protein
VAPASLGPVAHDFLLRWWVLWASPQVSDDSDKVSAVVRRIPRVILADMDSDI